MTKLPSGVSQATVDAVLSFVNASTLAVRKSVLDSQWSNLNADDVDAVFDHLIQDQKNTDEDIAYLRSVRHLLDRCRNEGITQALGSPPQSFPDGLEETVRSYLNAKGNDDAKAVVQTSRTALLSDEATRMLEFMEAYLRDDPKLVRHISERRAALDVSRTKSLEEAFPSDSITIREDIANSIAAFMSAGTWENKKAVLRAHQAELLSQDADHLLEFLASATQESDPSQSEELEIARALLGRCRTEGIDNVVGSLDRASSQMQSDRPTPEELEELRAEIDKLGGHTGMIREADIESLLKNRPDLEPAWIHLRSDLMTVNDNDRDRARLAELLGEFQALHGSTDFERQIAVLSEALELPIVQIMRPLWASLQHSLGAALSQCPSPIRAQLIDRAIEHHKLALTVFDRDRWPEERANNLRDMGNAFAQRTSGDMADNLEQALHCYEEAIQIRLSMKKESVATDYFNLGYALTKRIRGSRKENLEKAVGYFTKGASKIRRADSPRDWADGQHHLANALLLSQSGDRSQNIEQAIACYKKALEVYQSVGATERIGMSHLGLAQALRERIVGDRDENLHTSIVHAQAALNVFSKELWPEKWGEAQNLLGILFTQEESKGDTELLIKGIRCFETAQTVLDRQGYPGDWAKVQTNLAAAYGKLAAAGIEGAESKAIELYQGALEVYTRKRHPERWSSIHYNMGLLYAQSADSGATRHAEEHLKLALEARHIDVVPADYLDTQGALARLLFRDGRWTEAHEALSLAIEAGDQLLAYAYTQVGQRHEIGEISDLYVQDVFCLLKLNHLEQALLRLEEGKTRLLAQALSITNADLEALPAPQREDLRSVRLALKDAQARVDWASTQEAGGVDESVIEDLLKLRHKLAKIIARIRVEHEDFMPRNLDVHELLQLAPPDGALILPFVTSAGGGAFILQHGLEKLAPSNVVYCNSLTTQALRTRLLAKSVDQAPSGWLRAYFERDDRFHAWQQTIDMVTSYLWDCLLGPVHARLRELGVIGGGRLIILPQGGLGILPLHATWRLSSEGRRYLLDDYAVSYAPSGYALSVSRQRITKRKLLPNSLLAVIDPTGDLPGASPEGDAVAVLFPGDSQMCLEGAEATREAVIAGVPGRSYLHFACHGAYDWDDPVRSHLLLHASRPLTFADIVAQLNLDRVRLVTLSACETGITESMQSPDEYLGLPAAFLQSGAPTVVSTLWAVDDLPTMLLMERFYQCHLQQAMTVPEALRSAQTWLRRLTNADLVKIFHAFRKAALDQPRTGVFGRLARKLLGLAPKRKSMGYSLEQVSSLEDSLGPDQNACPFEHPHYWAAFTCVGD